MKLIFLGTGTSHGIPVIACDCKVCRSKNKKDKRYRSSAYVIGEDGTKILIDIGPEFRMQALNNKIKKVDAVLLTHSHADHLHGLDDLRIFSCVMTDNPENPNNEKLNAPPIPIYTNQVTKDDLIERFSYLFNPLGTGGGHAKIQVHLAEKEFKIGNITITQIPIMHGKLPVAGWMLSETKAAGIKNSIAYLTDCNYISDESIALIKEKCGNLKHLIIDGLRIKPHSTHFSFLQALEVSAKIGGEKIWFTHLTHCSSHKEVIKYINEHKSEFEELKTAKSILPAYDKLTINS